MAKKKKSKGVRPPPELRAPETKPPQITPPRTISPPREVSLPRQITPPREVTPPREITPPREPTPPKEPTPPREVTPPPEIYQEERRLSPSPGPSEVYLKANGSHINYGPEEVPKAWDDGFDDKESEVPFLDSSVARLSIEDSEHVTSEVPAADFNAGSTHSADEGYEHVSVEPAPIEELAPTEGPEPTEELAPIKEPATIEEAPTEEQVPDEQISSDVKVLDLLQYNQLPRIPPPDEYPRAGPHNGDGFELEKLIGAIQNGYSAEELREYLSYYHKIDGLVLKKDLNAEIRGYPAIFFVAETNDAELIRSWIKYGGDPNATYGPLRFPLLAFAILRGARPRLQAARTTETLLRLGASPLVIPAAYYNPFDRDLPESGPDEKELHDIENGERLWCTPEIRSRLVTALSLTQRYRLWQASSLEPASGRQQTLASRKDAGEILGLQQTIIGQKLAAWSLTKSFLVHIALPNKKPLVLLFAGPRGHGKRQLAKRLAKLLALELEKVDCASFNRDDELFGIKSLDQGSPLNDFLAQRTGQRSIVFLDEFDKTSEDVHKSLLIPFDRGEYIDRRNGQKIDCSQTIWVLATSKFDDTIRGNDKLLRNSNPRSQHDTLRRQLHRSLRNECITSFGAPLTSRITEIIPFLTFDPVEQAIIADRCIMELETVIAAPAVKSENPDDDKPVGNVQLEIANNASVCSIISKEYYLPELGAESIAHGVNAAIANPVISQYLEEGDDFGEDQAETRLTIRINEENEVEVLPELSTSTGYPSSLGLKYY